MREHYKKTITIATILWPLLIADSTDINNELLPSDHPITLAITPAYSSQNIDSVLGQNAWVQLSSASAPNAKLTIKGQRATVLYNGIALNQFNSQAQNIALIPENTINKINVTPSPSSVLYGAMGIGGAIEIAQKFSNCNQYRIGTNVSYPDGGGIHFFINQLLDKAKTSQLQLSGTTATTDSYRDYSRNFNNVVTIAWLHQTPSRELLLNFSDSYQHLQFPGSLSQSQVDQNPWQSSSTGKQKYINHVINSQIIFKQMLNNHWRTKVQSQYQ